MALFQRQELRQVQTQGLVMTPQLQQAIKLLQLSSVELNAYVEEQLLQNPLLERVEGDGDGAPVEPVEVPAEAPILDTATAVSDGADMAARAAEMDTSYENVWDKDGAADFVGTPLWGEGGGGGDGGEFGIEQTLAEVPTLREHLIGQIDLDIRDSADRLIALHLVDHLDAAGYFRADLPLVAAMLGAPVERVTGVLTRLQQLDPAGIFARNLSECLALQLRDRNRLDPAMQALLDNLDVLARRDFAALRSLCGVDGTDLAEMVAELKALNPKPALLFEHEPVQTVVPDILMRRDNDGGWLVELNAEVLPKVLVNSRYYARVRRGATDKAEREFISDQYNAANWLVKSLHQRAQTVLKVAVELVRQQDAFFMHGVQHLRPLTLRDIAEAIEMHESTVSRVTTSKHIATPRGLFELKYFFTSGIASVDGGAAHSAEAVRYRIKNLIDEEPPTDVLSDDKIVDLLRVAGIDIARRTVAKYREALRIPSSVQRRREKMAQLV